MNRIWVILTLLAAASAVVQADVTGVSGPAQATWGSTINVSVSVANPGEVATARQKFEIAMRQRAARPMPWQTLMPVEIRPIWQGAKVDVSFPVILPAAPDLLGNLDGDFDIAILDPAATEPSKPVCDTYPLHIETRDADGTIDGAFVPRNYDLLAANSSPARTSPDWLIQTGIRHAREDCTWGEFEPEEGKWDEKAFGPESRFGSLLLQHRKHDMTALPMIGGIPTWAQAKDAEGKPMGGWGPPADSAKWAAFVDKVVGYYSKAPYYQRDWQIWNEASGTVNTGFWTGGSWENYINQVHNPAARAIRSHHADYNGNGKEDLGERCRVVYGGFPCSNWNDASYAKVLETDGAGDLTDILDAHYMQGLKWFQDEKLSGNVYDKWIATGKAHGAWQTEDGHSFADDPTWIPTIYFADFSWALAHNWNHKDKYREYFFHYYAAEPNRGFYWSGDTPKWPNGYAISTLMRVTRGDLAPVGSKRTVKMVARGQVIDGASLLLKPILAGGRMVFLFARPIDTPEGSVTFEIPLRTGEHVKALTRTTLVRGVERAVRFETINKTLKFELPWIAVTKDEAGMDNPKSPWAYITIECTKPMTTWGDGKEWEKLLR